MEFEALIKKYKDVVDKRLESFFDREIRLTSDQFMRTNYLFLREFVLRGGKRLRPIAAIMAYIAINGRDDEKIFLPAIGAELFHASSLIHDDIMDEDDLRRGKQTMHNKFSNWFLKQYGEKEYAGKLFNKWSKRFGVSMAIIQGNMLYSLGESCLTNSDFDDKVIREALSICNNAYKTVNEGQVLDILLALKRNIKEKDYFDMALKKTAKLFSASIEVGAVLANATISQRKALTDYASNSAITFQIQDDIMDINAKMQKGHDIGSDIRKGKYTLLIIKALELANKDEKEKLIKILGKENSTKDEINTVIKILDNTGAIAYSRKIALGKIKEGKNFLKKADLTKEGLDFFNSFADYMINREI
ncbi:polyprenyl synthetase family protein [Candidatus Woesearchaeota archaeon]|nr:polyprenyl synthetase family protein [Candidatus Woesearchaeota archaeon]